MHKALHPRDDIDRLYASRKEGERRLANIEDSVDASIQRLEDNIQKHDEGPFTATRNDYDNTMDNRMTITMKQNGKDNKYMGVIMTNKRHLTRQNLDMAKKRRL